MTISYGNLMAHLDQHHGVTIDFENAPISYGWWDNTGNHYPGYDSPEAAANAAAEYVEVSLSDFEYDPSERVLSLFDTPDAAMPVVSFLKDSKVPTQPVKLRGIRLSEPDPYNFDGFTAHDDF